MSKLFVVLTVIMVAMLSACGTDHGDTTVTMPNPSMEPTFVMGDILEARSTTAYAGHRGDIVALRDPGGWVRDQDRARGELVVGRVIGRSGDHVMCCDDQGRVTVNDKPLNEESRIPKDTPPSLTRFDSVVPQGYLWVMGDNRSDSSDSREHMGLPGGGFVSTDLVRAVIIGKKS